MITDHMENEHSNNQSNSSSSNSSTTPSHQIDSSLLILSRALLICVKEVKMVYDQMPSKHLHILVSHFKTAYRQGYDQGPKKFSWLALTRHCKQKNVGRLSYQLLAETHMHDKAKTSKHLIYGERL
jgi:hypothetical protein